ncbi:MAG TPA: biotin transporter BioY [Candidatus Atribacteria bacterium]|nr:biotin transporter BioY [Candidatus Atribacteria bacterium]HPT78435.1 biotin transporter BioY [Candidatus Atribacteria bacterium]
MSNRQDTPGQPGTSRMILTALFTALTAIGAFINIPTPTVPFSLQFLFCAYAGILLGPKLGLVSQLLYIALGLVGLPLFTKGGGFNYIFQPSFGFILGFALCAFVTGALVHTAKNPGILRLSLAVLAGLFSTYALGVPYLYFMLNRLAEPGKAVSFMTAVKLGVAPFILFDLAKCAIIVLTALKLLPVLRKRLF